MSTIDLNNNHSVVAYTAGVTKPLAGQRLSVVFWKKDKETGIKKDSKCVSIPTIAGITPEELQQMIPHCVALLEQAQNKIIREAIDNNKTTILGADITVAKCIEYLNEVGTGAESQRLTSESIASWYDATIADTVMLAVSEKLGIGDEPTQEQASKVEKICAHYKETLSKLASGSFKLGEDYVVLCKKVVSFAPEGDAVAPKLLARLDKMVVKDEDMLLAL